MQEVIIPYNKANIGLGVLLAVGFIGIGVWMIASISEQYSVFRQIAIWLCGVVTITTFGFFSVIGITKIFTKRAGLLLNSKGFKKRLYGKDVFIEWSDVKKIYHYKIKRQKIITVSLKNPSKYVFNDNIGQKLWSGGEGKLGGTPITLASNPLEIEFDELYKLMNSYLDKSREQ